MTDPIHIAGAGPAGLAAAVNLAKGGYDMMVHEKNPDVGMRFNGDFQGIENWSSETDALPFLESVGVSVNLKYNSFNRLVTFDPSGRRHVVKSRKPLFYLVERGNGSDSLDQSLKRQAIGAGAKFILNKRAKEAKQGKVIVATGPKVADAIAKGILFGTSYPDPAITFADNRIAPKAYACLLVSGGRATFATCLFEDFKNARDYFERALERMQKLVKIDIQSPKQFGDYVNFFLRPRFKGTRFSCIGECAGLQDGPWGFGIRYAIMSGALAARSIMRGRSYERLARKKMSKIFEVSITDRFIFSHLGNRRYETVLSYGDTLEDLVEWLKKWYNPSPFKTVAPQVTKRWYHSRIKHNEWIYGDSASIR